MNQSSSPPGLVRGLGPYMAIAVVVGTVIGTGVFYKPQTVAQNVPNFAWAAAAWVSVGVLAILGALTLAEIVVLYPRAGGNYVFLREGYGRCAAFLWGWVEFLIIRCASQAALATIFTENFHSILKLTTGKALFYWEEKSLTMAIIIGLAFVNVRGVRWGGGLQLAISLVKVASLLGIMLLPWIWLAMSRDIPVSAVAELPSKVPAEFTLMAFLTAILGPLWAYHGWMNIAPVAEEVRNPSRNLPLALMAGVGIVMFLYLGANLAYHQVLPMSDLSNTPRDMAAATFCASTLLGQTGEIILSAAIMFSVFGALNGNLLVGPRVLYAMGRDQLAPQALGAVHPRFHTPALAILVMASWSALLVFIVALLTYFEWLDPKKSHFDRLTDFTMFGALVFETLAITTIFVFRRRYPNAERPYRCWGYPVVPALYLILPALVVQNMFRSPEQQIEALTGAGIMLVGAVVYFAIYFRAPGQVAPETAVRAGAPPLQAD